jgi:hypothetical protein
MSAPRRRTIRNSQSGLTSLEVVLMGVLCAVVAVVTIDMAMVMWGYTFNDQACRDAARAAAAATNPDTGYRAAQAALEVHRADGAIVTDPICDRLANPNDFIFVDKPPDGMPYVQVTTRAQVHVPFAFDLWGKLSQFGNVKCAKTYLFPLLNLDFYPRPVVTGNREVEPDPPTAWQDSTPPTEGDPGDYTPPPPADTPPPSDPPLFTPMPEGGEAGPPAGTSFPPPAEPPPPPPPPAGGGEGDGGGGDPGSGDPGDDGGDGSQNSGGHGSHGGGNGNG